MYRMYLIIQSKLNALIFEYSIIAPKNCPQHIKHMSTPLLFRGKKLGNVKNSLIIKAIKTYYAEGC